MKLREIKTRTHHYFTDEQGRRQGQYKDWYESGKQRIISHWRDGRIHGEYRSWDLSGKLQIHTFDINGEEMIDFKKNPELYPSTPEGKTYFALKYGIGDARFIGDSSETH